MKRLSVMVLSVMLCLAMAMGAVALAENTTPKLLGTWKSTSSETEVFSMTMMGDGNGEAFMNGESLGKFGFALRGENMASLEPTGENGSLALETCKMVVTDEDTVVGTVVVDGISYSETYVRTAPADADSMTLDNAFLGTWVADLPEAKGLVMTYLPDGSYTFEAGELKGECGYFVFENNLVSLTDEGEAEQFTFEVVDKNTINVTELSSGVMAPFTRVTETQEDAA